jgi:hypothetical protein
LGEPAVYKGEEPWILGDKENCFEATIRRELPFLWKREI